MSLFSRRDALKYFGLGIMNMMIPINFEYTKTTGPKIMTPKRLWMCEGTMGANHWDAGTVPKVGDDVWFYPCAHIDCYIEIDPPERPVFNHVFLDIYEFNFRPVQAVHTGLDDNTYHYFVELLPNFPFFNYQWKRELKVGQWYKGYGIISNSEDPSVYTPLIGQTRRNSILQRGRIEEILVNPLSVSDLRDMGYWDDFAQFKRNLNLEWYRHQEFEPAESTELREVLAFCVRLG